METAPNPKHHKKPTRDGFTLIELLIVIAIIGILAGILAMVLNPDFYLGDSRNARRKVDLHTIGVALTQYALANSSAANLIPESDTEICRTDAFDCTGYLDLSVLTNNQAYLSAIPLDPKGSSENGTGYFIYENEHGRYVFSAPHAERGEVIEVVR